ncbi:MAG: hypothetical protein K0S01_1018 [Herbinix sp.]|jgi:hypothetical protein|nr:hypothetical protein [Herbinix sp.]
MNQLDKSHVINEKLLDQRFYFQSLFQEACSKHLLADTQIERIQLEMVELMAKEVERYTNDESSSVLVEKAQELLQSITYNIGVYLKSVSDMTDKIDYLKKEKISTLFYQGMDTVSALKSKAALLLQNLQKNSLRVNNISYVDTIFTGIPEFFHDYNIEFGAHEMNGSIDYQLCETNENLLGVEYIHEYLHRFTIEHNFIKRFEVETVNQLLRGFDKEAEHMLINVFELVLTNALGCELIGTKILELNLFESDREWLQNSLEKSELEELKNKLQVALGHIAVEIDMEAELIDYAKRAIPQLASRLKNNLQTKTLEKLFISFADQKIQEEIFEDGTSMEDEKLRELIEKLRDLDTADKVTMIKETVHSLADLIELLEECFYEDEYVEVFQLLSEAERLVLTKSIQIEAGIEDIAEYEPEKEWQKKLLAFR